MIELHLFDSTVSWMRWALAASNLQSLLSCCCYDCSCLRIMSSSLEMLSGLQALDQFEGCLSRLCSLLIILCFLLVSNILQGWYHTGWHSWHIELSDSFCDWLNILHCWRNWIIFMMIILIRCWLYRAGAYSWSFNQTLLTTHVDFLQLYTQVLCYINSDIVYVFYFLMKQYERSKVCWVLKHDKIFCEFCCS